MELLFILGIVVFHQLAAGFVWLILEAATGNLSFRKNSESNPLANQYPWKQSFAAAILLALPTVIPLFNSPHPGTMGFYCQCFFGWSLSWGYSVCTTGLDSQEHGTLEIFTLQSRGHWRQLPGFFYFLWQVWQVRFDRICSEPDSRRVDQILQVSSYQLPSPCWLIVED